MVLGFGAFAHAGGGRSGLVHAGVSNSNRTLSVAYVPAFLCIYWSYNTLGMAVGGRISEKVFAVTGRRVSWKVFTLD